jgi:hypothetical protein
MASEVKWAFGGATSTTCTVRVSRQTDRFTGAELFSITLSPFTVNTTGVSPIPGATTTTKVTQLPATDTFRAIGSVAIYDNTGGTQGDIALTGVVTQTPTGELQLAFPDRLTAGEYAISGCGTAATL